MPDDERLPFEAPAVEIEPAGENEFRLPFSPGP